MPEKEITIEIKRPEIILLLISLGIFFVLELRVTFNTPIAFGDEGFHTRMAQWIYENKEYPIWIPFEGTKIFRNSFSRPPVFNLLEAGFWMLTRHEFIIRFLTPFTATILTGLGIYLLGKKIFDEKIAFIASIITITVPSFVTYSVLFYVDILFTFYFSLFVLTLILGLKNGDKKYWLLSSVFAALCLLTKTPGYVVFPFIFLAFFYEFFSKKDLTMIRKYIVFFIILSLISGTWFLRNLMYYNTPACNLPVFDTSGCKKTFDYEVKTEKKFAGRTTPTGTELDVMRMGITNYLQFAYGFVWFIPLFFLCGLYLVLKRRSAENILLLLVFVAFIPVISKSTGRAEDTARFTLGLVPVIAFIAGSYLKKVYEFLTKYYKKLGLIVFILVFAVGWLNLNEKLSIMSRVKQFSPTFFEACDWIKKNTPENASLMSIWGHRLVYNCQRDSAGYADLPDSRDIILSGDLNLTLSRLKAHGITHIYLQKFSIDRTAYKEKYPISFVQFLENHPDVFVKVYENGPSLEQCLQQGMCDGNILYEIKY